MWAMSAISSAPTSSAISRERLEVDDARVGARRRTMISFGWCSRASWRELVVVDRLGVLAHAVGDDLEGLAGEVERVAVGEVAAVGEVHAEDDVARLAGREVDGHVGLRAGVRLDVGVVAAEELLRPRRGRAPRRRRRTRSRRSSACRDSPRRTCWSAPSPSPRAPPARRSSRRRSARGPRSPLPLGRSAPRPRGRLADGDLEERRRRRIARAVHRALWSQRV